MSGVVRRLASMGYAVDGEALKLLNSLDIDEDTIVERLSSHMEGSGRFVISKEDVEKVFGDGSGFRVIYTFSDYTFSGRGADELYRSMFIDRYLKLSSMFQRQGVAKIEEITGGRIDEGEEISIIGLVREVSRRSGGRHIEIVLEDPGGEVRVFAFRGSDAYGDAEMVGEDEVIMVSGRLRRDRRGGGYVIYADEISWPGVGLVGGGAMRVPTAFVSDIHVGSRHFDRDRFSRFIDFLNGSYGGPREREVGRSVRFLVIAGDVVDGIGVFPRQEEELEIMDIYDQYGEACRYLSRLRRNIRIIIIPGNHDLTGYAVPSKPLPRELFKGCGDVVLLGDPALIEIGGVKILLAHGRSLDDAVARYSRHGYTPEGVAEAMKALLTRRLLAVTYGRNTPMAPNPVDMNVIREVPKIFVMGHVHIAAYRRFRGVDIINTGSWQRQTRYQRSMGVEPTVGTAFIAGLGDKPVMLRF